MRFNSLRVKIITIYTSILVLTLLLFSAVLYQNLSKMLNSNLDDVLKLWSKGIIDSIDIYWESERLEAIEGGIQDTVFRKRNNINFSKIAKRWVQEKSQDPTMVNIIIQIYDANANLIVSTKDIPEINMSGKPEYPKKSDRKGYYETLSVELKTGKLTHLRAYTVPVIENKDLAYSVKIISQISPINSTMKDLKWLLLILLPITVVLAGFISTSIAKITLGQVDQMISTIRLITEKNMNIRIGLPDTRDEIKVLAESLNDMLSRLENSFESQKKFIEDVTHEIKTPLSIMRGEIEYFLQKETCHPEYERMLRSNLEEINRITKIVEDLLMLARFDTRVMTLEIREMDIAATVREITEIVTILAHQKCVEIVIDAPDHIMIPGDRNKLNRLFMNVLDNAVKYTPTGGKIQVSILRDEDYVRISIADTGIGISEEDIQNIFNRFYRVDRANSPTGYGLGLCIAKSIVDAHHGQIDVLSSIGKGSVFSISLPL
jgi:heavy metal sensor kinase